MKRLSFDLDNEILLLLKSRGGSGEPKRDDDSSSLEEFDFEVEGYRVDFSKLAGRYERCHKDAILFHCKQCGKVYIVPYACNLVICEHCSKKRARAIYRRYYKRIKTKYDLKHVTLTWGHEDLRRDILREIYCKFVRLLKEFWSSFIAVLEISRTGHIHLHAIVSGKYVPQPLLSDKAEEIVGRPVVWINRAVPKKLGYLVKYISKPPMFPKAQDFIRFLVIVYRFRRIRSYGEFYGKEENKTLSLLCKACGWYLKYDGVEEEGWIKQEHPYLFEGYDPPYEVIVLYGGMR